MLIFCRTLQDQDKDLGVNDEVKSGSQYDSEGAKPIVVVTVGYCSCTTFTVTRTVQLSYPVLEMT